ncbi:MAG: hypothetical protein C0594_12670 [Marinilabiliales bacterium]|mgnify:CR=1 FL=1|nr:MAG: hypothetical protein C0594_12670 [Marinilabiliales bacterium]
MLPSNIQAQEDSGSQASIEILTIQAYSDDAFTEDTGDSFTAQFNPETIKHVMNIDYDTEQAIGSSGADVKYKQTRPETLSFRLEFSKSFDASNVDGSNEDLTKAVINRVEDLKDVIFAYSGDIHRPYFIQLSWGDFTFKGQTTGIDVTYSMYDISGEPKRASIELSFIGSMDVQTRAKSENRSSPDLSHYIEFKDGDSLPVICNKIYGSPDYYLEIARINKLSNFRNIEPGRRLLFPPLEK